MTKRFFSRIILVSFCISHGSILIASDQSQNNNQVVVTANVRTPFSNDEGTVKIIKRNQIQDEARRFEKQGLYDEAMAMYRKATDSSLLNYDYEAGVAIGGIERIYQKQGRFELALKELQWHLERNPEKYQDRKLELEALIKARDTNSPQPIYAHIEYLRNKYKEQLPPSAGIYADTITSHIIRLCDHIGDMDAGIAFMNEFIDYYAAKWGVAPKKIGKKNQHLLIREAFEQDKKEGFKGCLDAKPGETCMGRATKALIESDYFPW